MKTGLVLEGGANRTLFSCGVMDAFLDYDKQERDRGITIYSKEAFFSKYASKTIPKRHIKFGQPVSSIKEEFPDYYDARDAIVELNEARVDAIKDGIDKEVDAYTKLINKKKELLDAEKD